jgi:orotate phosphoribosyltransferase
MNVTVADALLDIGAVGFALDKPVRFKSGILSPIYVDNRTFPFHPKEWKLMIQGFEEMINSDQIQFDVVAGVESAGIPHSAALGFLLRKPSVFVRKTAKDHGLKKMIEGGDVKGKKVLLVEDHITTGGSSVQAANYLREAGAIVTDCLSITSYEFRESIEAFKNGKIHLHTLTTFTDIFSQAMERKKLTQQEVQYVHDWLNDPKSWAKRHGFE